MAFVIIFLIIIAIPLVLAALLSNDYSIEQEIIILQPRQRVFEYIKYLKNANQYNKWVMMDPNVRQTFSGIDGTPGFVYAWDSDNKNVGKGEQEITAIREGERIDYALRFIKPFENKADAWLATSDAPGGTKVVWAFSGQRSYGMKVFHLLLNLKKVIGKDLHTSLVNLKTILEK